MADDRPLEDPADAIRRLTADLADLQATVLARLVKRPTGDVELTIRSTPKPGTLLMQGQTVSRTTYAALWAWAQQQSLVVTGLFTVGDGSTTFGLPDWRGRVIVGVGTLGAESYAVGATGGTALRVMTWSQMPTHQHELIDGTGVAYNVGDHPGHNDGGVAFPPGSGGGAAPANSQIGRGAHGHDVQTAVFSLNSGSSAPFDVRQPFAAANYAIWT